MSQAREPRGVPSGGRFARTIHPEPEALLTHPKEAERRRRAEAAREEAAEVQERLTEEFADTPRGPIRVSLEAHFNGEGFALNATVEDGGYLHEPLYSEDGDIEDQARKRLRYLADYYRENRRTG